jgi:hypothetical protein
MFAGKITVELNAGFGDGWVHADSTVYTAFEPTDWSHDRDTTF